ncbi:MAG: 50S ribosomal protein L13 [Proteobacteria bacterium]|nr:50S ribosomal protein L13 [Pseudomonadota bacterium]
MKTFSAKADEIKREWFVIDAENVILGRMATEIAKRLRGKHKPEYTPHVDTGDYIVVINAEKIAVTGNKMKNKIYYKHTGYIGNLKSITLEKQLIKRPEVVIETAVKGMLPKNSLGRTMYRKLKVYAGSEHPHEAQQPQTLEIGRK